ncbi:MAG: hypothetical protein WCD70_15840 [Alphaproteobacteria bacterium]
MNKPLPRAVMFGLMVVALPMSEAKAQSASCLSSPSTVGCLESVVAAGTSETISPTFPNPLPSCEIVKDSCAFDFAVPVASQQEWSSFLQSEFLNTPGSCASASNCVAPVNGSCGGSNGVVFTMPCGGVSFCTEPGCGLTEGCAAGTLTNAGYSLNGTTFAYYWTCSGSNGGTLASCGYIFHSCLEM